MSEANKIEIIARALEAMDERLSGIDRRFVLLENHVAEEAKATEEQAIAMGGIVSGMNNVAESVGKLQRLYVSLDAKMDQTIDILQNFIDETRRLRSTSQQLISEVRKKTEACGGER